MKTQRRTQAKEVLMYMEEKGSITAMEGFTKLGVIDLAGVIRQIKRDEEIISEWVYTRNYFGKPIRYKKYKLKNPKREKIFEIVNKLIERR